MEQSSAFSIAKAADEIQEQLRQEPGLHNVRLEKHSSINEWAMSGTVVSEQLRQRIWQIFFGNRGNETTSRVWDFVSVKPEASGETVSAAPAEKQQ